MNLTSQLDGSGQEAFHHRDDFLWPPKMRGTQGFRELSHLDGAQEGLSRPLLHSNFLLRLSVKANKLFPSSTLECCSLFSSFQVHWESTRFFQTPLTMLARSPSGWFHPMWHDKTFQVPTVQTQSQKVREKSQSLWKKDCTNLLRSLLQGQGSSQEKDMYLTFLRDVQGEGNGTPLQCSCLENPMDGGAWWAAVHGVAKSWIRLSDFTFSFHFHALEKEMATHSSVLAWRIPGTGEPGGLPSMGSHRVGHD